jgi:hypothetical protein
MERSRSAHGATCGVENTAENAPPGSAAREAASHCVRARSPSARAAAAGSAARPPRRLHDAPRGTSGSGAAGGAAAAALRAALRSLMKAKARPPRPPLLSATLAMAGKTERMDSREGSPV